MIRLFVLTVVFSLMNLCAFKLAAHDPEDPFLLVHDKQYFVKVDSLTPELVIDQLLLDMNSISVWEDEDLSLAVWEIVSFPFTTSDGSVILDINDAITTARTKTQIESATYNFQQQIDWSTSAFQNQECFDITQYYNAQGEESILISILDTGISNISDNSTSTYNYQLQNYTGYDYVEQDSIPNDMHGHGSHIAGLIHSITHQSNPLEAHIEFDIRKTHDENGSAYLSSVVFAIFDALEEGADIINMSFSVQSIFDEDLFFPLFAAIQEAEDEGTLIIAAAGNTSIDNDNYTFTSFPATVENDNVISVASHNCQMELSLYSNYGSKTVDIVTLGEHIPGPDLGNGIIYVDGTSQATALTTALLALKASHQLEFDGGELKCQLLQSEIHKHNLTDKIVSDGYLGSTHFLSASTVCNPLDTCIVNNNTTIQLQGAPTQNLMVETMGNIRSNQVINGQLEITFDTANTIELLQGFTISQGSIFNTFHNGCD